MCFILFTCKWQFQLPIWFTGKMSFCSHSIFCFFLAQLDFATFASSNSAFCASSMALSCHEQMLSACQLAFSTCSFDPKQIEHFVPCSSAALLATLFCFRVVLQICHQTILFQVMSFATAPMLEFSMHLIEKST